MVSVINVLASYVACLSFILLTFHFAKRRQISKVDLVAHLKSINPGMPIFMLAGYTKSEKVDLTRSELKAARDLARQLVEIYRR